MQLTLFLITGWLLGLSAPGQAEDVAGAHLELFQKHDVVVDHQRFIGNLRAQSKRDGIVARVPQLYVYLAEHGAAWHMTGFRPGFENELHLTVTHRRHDRNMVPLDRLLERTLTIDGDEITPAQLPRGDVYVLVYQRADCADCKRIVDSVSQWLEDNPEISAVWIDIWIDRQPDS